MGRWFCSTCVDCQICRAKGALGAGLGVEGGRGGDSDSLVKDGARDAESGVSSDEGIRIEVKQELMEELEKEGGEGRLCVLAESSADLSAALLPAPPPLRSLWGTSLSMCCECEADQTARKEAEAEVPHCHCHCNRCDIMLCCAVICCAVLCCTMLCCTVLWRCPLNDMSLYCYIETSFMPSFNCIYPTLFYSIRLFHLHIALISTSPFHPLCLRSVATPSVQPCVLRAGSSEEEERGRGVLAG